VLCSRLYRTVNHARSFHPSVQESSSHKTNSYRLHTSSIGGYPCLVCPWSNHPSIPRQHLDYGPLKSCRALFLCRSLRHIAEPLVVVHCCRPTSRCFRNVLYCTLMPQPSIRRCCMRTRTPLSGSFSDPSTFLSSSSFRSVELIFNCRPRFHLHSLSYLRMEGRRSDGNGTTSHFRRHIISEGETVLFESPFVRPFRLFVPSFPKQSSVSLQSFTLRSSVDRANKKKV